MQFVKGQNKKLRNNSRCMQVFMKIVSQTFI